MVPTPQVGKGRREGKRGARRRLPWRDVGHQQRRVAAVGNAAHPVSPGRKVCCDRGNDSRIEKGLVMMLDPSHMGDVAGAATC